MSQDCKLPFLMIAAFPLVPDSSVFAAYFILSLLWEFEDRQTSDLTLYLSLNSHLLELYSIKCLCYPLSPSWIVNYLSMYWVFRGELCLYVFRTYYLVLDSVLHKCVLSEFCVNSYIYGWIMLCWFRVLCVYIYIYTHTYIQIDIYSLRKLHGVATKQLFCDTWFV